jgi:hypothetical protein
MQEHQPGRAGLPCTGGQRSRAGAIARQETAAGDIGHALDHAGSAAVDQ